MSSAPIIDMSKLPAPDVVVVPDFEAILADLKADLVAAMPAELRAAIDATLSLESEPLTKWLERLAFQLVVERSDRNDSAHAVMLAYARRGDLDQLGAFYDVGRLVITPADTSAMPPVEAVMEDDESLRARIQLAPRGFSVAGPGDAYVSHARAVDGQVLDASAITQEAGTVLLSVLSRSGDGTPSNELLEKVRGAVNADDVRPLSDTVIVKAATIVNYSIGAKIYTLRGPDSSGVLALVRERAAAYAKAMHRLGRKPTLSGIYAALHIDGVGRVELSMPLADIGVGPTQASWCTSIDIAHGGSFD